MASPISGKARTTTVQAEVPVQLLDRLQGLVEDGWFRDLDEVILDALRRFAESHPTELMERFLHQDVEWGLHGRD
jgi:Arc/MetJ-type ribon-helix-helix transcriptional regulator